MRCDKKIMDWVLGRFLEAATKYHSLYHGAVHTEDPDLKALLESGDAEERARFWREALPLSEAQGDDEGHIIFVGVGLGEPKPIRINAANWEGRMFDPHILDDTPYDPGHYDPSVEMLPEVAPALPNEGCASATCQVAFRAGNRVRPGAPLPRQGPE